MDLITASIVGALAAGVAGGIGEAGKKLIVDAYTALTDALKQKFGVDSDLGKALDGAEKKPDSKGRQDVLAEEIVTAKAAEDPELLKLAQSLAEALKKESGGAYNATVTGNNNTVVQGDHNVTATGGGIAIGGNVGGDVKR